MVFPGPTSAASKAPFEGGDRIAKRAASNLVRIHIQAGIEEGMAVAVHACSAHAAQLVGIILGAIVSKAVIRWRQFFLLQVIVYLIGRILR